MRIRSKLSLSYFVIIAITGVLMILLARSMVDHMAAMNLTSAEKAVTDLADENYQWSEKRLTEYGEMAVKLKCKEVAATLALMLQGLAVDDYGRLRKNAELRRVATQTVHTTDGEAGYVDVLDKKGVAVLHPNRDVEGRNYEEWKDQFPEMWKLVERSFTEPLVAGYYDFVDKHNRTRKKYLTLVHVRGTPFIVCTAVNIDQYFLPAHEKIRAVHEMTLQWARAAIMTSAGTTLGHVMTTGLIGGLVFLAFVGGLAVWMAGSMAGPVMHLRDGVQQIAEGNFQAKVLEEGSDEVRHLARTFNKLGGSLTDYMANLREATASKQRIESELSIAAEIQRSLIPRTFPPFPERDEFEIYALMHPARAVGGDFYDFFLLDETDLFFTVCDVSGKGVPAAIFMAVTRSLLGAAARTDRSPDSALTRVNEEICASNDTFMFATVFCGMLNVKTGRLVYANAGHNPPLVIRGADRLEFLDPPSGPVLGLFPEESFAKRTCVLQPGDTLFVFTDGVTEAANCDERFFEKDRLKRRVAARAGERVDKLVNGVRDDISAFVDGAPQWDDITMLAVKYLNRR